MRTIRAFAKAIFLTVGLLAVGLALAGADANAAYVFGSSIGGPCTGSSGKCEPGQLQEPTGVAVNEDTGDIYVVDRATKSVKEFSPAGAQLGEFNGAEAGHALVSPEDVAVDNSESSQDPSDHDVYVSDPAQDLVEKFSASGEYLGQLSEAEGAPFGELHDVAVDAAGHLWIYQQSKVHGGHQEIDEYSDGQPNAYLSNRFKPVGHGGSPGFAVDSEGNMYLNGSGPRVVMKTDREGSELITELDDETSTGVAVNPANDVFVDNIDEKEGDLDTIAEFSPGGSLVERFGAGHLSEGGSLAVDAAENTVYVADTGAHTIATFVGPQTPLRVISGEASGLQNDGGATLEGSVNPKGTPVTSCEFEYATSEEYSPALATYGHSVPCSSPHAVSEADPLTGSAPIPVSATISGVPLRPGKLTVHYRLKAGDPTVGYGSDKTYLTAPFTAPVVGGLPAANVSQFAATLDATVETDQAPVDYRFEYGTTTAYGSVAPIPNGYAPTAPGVLSLSQTVSGLQAGTTYHYRIVASGALGTNVAGPDETFTTLAVPVPTVLSGGSSEVGVSSATLAGTVDPHGWGTTYLFEYGTSTAYGQRWPTVPVDMGALEGPQPVLVTVPGLLPGTTYHYRLVASDGGGTSYGQDMTFTTGQYPAPAIQEPPTLRTLLVPSEAGAAVTSKPQKKRKRGGSRAGRHGKRRRKTGRVKRTARRSAGGVRVAKPA